jgi:hypothetical protein
MAVLVAALLLAAGLWAQPGPGEGVFLGDKSPIPEAALYDSAQHRASGAAAGFAAARGEYDLGQYPRAAQRLAALVEQYPQHSAAWVYLARAQFHLGEYAASRQTLARAGQRMPELGEDLWQPLDRGLVGEVRRLAAQLQAQVDYYPQRQADFAPLLQLYGFLQDSTAARELVRQAAERRAELFRQAESASGSQRQSYLEAAGQWDRLIAGLGGAPDSAGRTDSLRADESLRLLQLRVDYYLAKPQEYQQLFGLYLGLGRRAEAAGVVQALEREGQRLSLLAEVAPTAPEAGRYRDQAAACEALRQQFQAQLDSSTSP